MHAFIKLLVIIYIHKNYSQDDKGIEMNFWLFVAVFTSLMALLNLYTYKRFLKKLITPLNSYVIFIPIILLALEILFSLDRVLHILPESQALYYFILSSVGITTALFIMAIIYDVNLSVSKRIPYNQERRQFIKIIFDTTIVILAFTYLFKGFKGAIDKPRLNVVDVKIDNFVGEFTIMQLSDVHVGKTIKKDSIEDIVKRVNAQNPDMVVLTGDVIDDEVENIKEDLLPLKDLKADSYFVLGNHEYFHGVDKAIEMMKSLGIKVMLNESLVIDNRFNLIGLKDLMGFRLDHHKMDVEKAYENIDKSLPSIVLAHQPKTMQFMKYRSCDLMLSGHTHGGQIFPLGLLVKLDQPYLAGLYQHSKKQQIFVSRGSGYWGPPFRFLAPSEISKIVIRGKVKSV